MGKTVGAGNLFDGLREAYGRYFDLVENGGSDPFRADGVNVNLERNHFIIYTRRIREAYPEKKWGCLDWILDRVVVDFPKDYMARPERIYADALRALSVYENDPDLRYIRDHIGRLSRKGRDETRADAVLGYHTGLGRAVKDLDLVYMRRHRDPRKYLDLFRECAGRMREKTRTANKGTPFEGESHA
jgi:hypothetical protein